YLDNSRPGYLGSLRAVGQWLLHLHHAGPRGWNRGGSYRAEPRTHRLSSLDLRIYLVAVSPIGGSAADLTGIECESRASHSTGLGESFQHLLEVLAGTAHGDWVGALVN